MKRLPAGVMAGALALVGASSLTIEAHKPITSPYTFAEDVLPILRDRCGACHVAGGPAPMPLTTPEETVPWGESIRLELIAGHMPPWSAMSGGRRLPHAEGLTARELNVLLTWVTGGTPPGDAKPAPVDTARTEWPLGAPDLTLPLPDIAVAADQAEVTREIVVPLDAAARRPLRAVDLRPGTRSLVRSARIEVRSASSGASTFERVVALWVPGDRPVALPAGTGFQVPSDAELVVTLRLKKTWEHEREAMSDASTLAIYFADPLAEPVRFFTGETMTVPTKILSIYPTPAAAGATITIDVMAEGALLQRLLEFTPQKGWERRYWFDKPFDIPSGARLQTSVKFARPLSPVSPEPAVVLNVVPVSR